MFVIPRQTPPAPPSRESLMGKLLVAHPDMQHECFRQTVILVVKHGAGGTFGTILNRPLQQKLGVVARSFSEPPLSDLAIYAGGPLDLQQLVFCNWHWLPGGNFQINFGLSHENALRALEQFGAKNVRAIVGTARWRPGQLERELRRNAWVVSRPVPALMMEKDGEALWRSLLGSANPILHMLSSAPANVALN
jgi:putative transcriptional regulator